MDPLLPCQPTNVCEAKRTSGSYAQPRLKRTFNTVRQDFDLRGRKAVSHMPILHESGRRDQLVSLVKSLMLQACPGRQERYQSRGSRP